MIHEDIFSVPIILNAYKSYRVRFFGESRNAQSPVRAKFMCRVGVGQYHIQFVQYKTITPMESPVNHKNQHVCLCVCIYVYVCLYVFIYLLYK